MSPWIYPGGQADDKQKYLEIAGWHVGCLSGVGGPRLDVTHLVLHGRDELGPVFIRMACSRHTRVVVVVAHW